MAGVCGSLSWSRGSSASSPAVLAEVFERVAHGSPFLPGKSLLPRLVTLWRSYARA